MLLEEAGRRVVEIAKNEWMRPVGNSAFYKPQVDIYRLEGVGWLAKEWCGAFAAWCWRKVGLHSKVAPLWASDYKLANLYGRYGHDTNIPYPDCILEDGKRIPLVEYHKNHGGPRLVLPGRKPSDVQPGDVVLVGSKKPLGGHITLAVELLPTGVRTLSGNGGGWWPVQETGEPDKKTARYGVVMQDYTWAQIALVVRPAPADIDSPLLYGG
jgi:hypothetical protein